MARDCKKCKHFRGRLTDKTTYASHAGLVNVKSVAGFDSPLRPTNTKENLWSTKESN